MVDQTESSGGGSATMRGAAVAIVATAPRPGLALPDACPPLSPAEAAGLQTAWLKAIAGELPGVAVHLCGRPADALPMLRYFAGPGVELRPWNWTGRGAVSLAALAECAAARFAEGHAPVLVRTADTPDVPVETLLACVEAARRGAVLGRDQRGAPWLLGGPDTASLADPAPTEAPWARSVQDHADLLHLWRERSAGHEHGAGSEHGADAVPPTLPVHDLQASLRWYETVLGGELLGRDEGTATLRCRGRRLRLAAVGSTFAPNGLCFSCEDPAAVAAAASAHGAVRRGDGPAPRIGGGIAATVTDDNGHRLCFASRGFTR